MLEELKRTILVISTDLDYRSNIVTLLETKGYFTEEVGNI